jgi:hypothetical protein
VSTDLPVIAAATDLATGIRVLAPTCSIAIVAAVGTHWQLLAHRGEIDVTRHWQRDIADRIRVSDRPEHESGCLVAPFSCVELNALVVIGPEPGQHVPSRIVERARPLLDGGGILLDRALTAQRHDRALRRGVAERRRRSGRAPRSIPDLERALAGLWPGAAAGFHPASAIERMPWTIGWAMRVATERGAPAVARRPTDEGLLPPDLRWEIAVPALDGAMLIEIRAAGEPADDASIATAACIVEGCADSPSPSSSPLLSSPAQPLLRHRPTSR